MLETLNLFRNLYRKFKPHRGRFSRDNVAAAFRFRYSCFKDLLDSNTQLLNIIADMEEKLQGRQIFGMFYVRSQAARAAFHAFRMIKNLDVLSGRVYAPLYEVLEKINSQIKESLGEEKVIPESGYILFYSKVTKEMVDWVGGKSASLGEVLNRVNLPIPGGFAITTRACEAFLTHNDLAAEINKRKMELDPQEPQTYERVSDEIQQLILQAQMLPALEVAIFEAFEQLAARSGGPESLRVSMRSSAIGEDSDLSFAGQYLSLLNVSKGQLLQAYKEVVASLYTPQAISYRLNKGIRGEDTAMSVACLEMVESVASGVMYSHHPFNPLEDQVLISAVWGLGPYAVEGVIIPDTYQVAKDDLNILKSEISRKSVQLVSNPEGGLKKIPVPPEIQDKPCLTPEQVKILACYALKLEEHYRAPQDVEWALDRQGHLLVLQSRPLQVLASSAGDFITAPPVAGYPLLLEGAAVAFPGVGCGPAFLVREDKDLVRVPEGAVLVAKHSSPKFVVAMPKAQAIVTDYGSISGHMASLAREFSVPTLLAAKSATTAIAEGMEITVDAYAGRVYQGRVPELLARRQVREPHMRGTPVYQILRELSELIIPLNLVDPKSPNFTPAGCRTLHDLGRLVHELSYTEMFKISDLVSDGQGGALKLEAPVPLDLYLIDLDGGLIGVKAGAHQVVIDQIASIPLRALLRGFMHPDLQARGPRPIQISGLLSVMREQMLAAPNIEERFGDRSYAIISDKYLNFSSRVGYHYSVLDTYCGQTVNKNYLTFFFKGGAADDLRRHRRVRAIALVLLDLDFSVKVVGDRVDARLQKYESQALEEKLDLLGRLLQYTRQMDMLMTTEASIELVAHNFLEGNYTLDLGAVVDSPAAK
ncbi:MAG: PEP/pyruvate-binding domain-containing protein [Desulfobaccales bacterium]|jgi:pyruvate,water dikinase